MDAGLDTGPVLAARDVRIGERETAGSLHDRLAPLGGELLVEALDAIAEGSAREQAQSQIGITYAGKITKAEALIDWREAATSILRRVRAFNPWPVAENGMNGTQLRIWDAELVPGIAYAWRRGERQVAIQALVLLLAAIGIDALGVRRGLKSEYFIFTDPLIILAGAILLDSLPDLRFRKWTFPVAMVLFGLHIAVGQAEPIKYAFMRRGPESICEWNRYYMPLLPLPLCPPSPAQP
jgi:hypothetical protein